jgi:hypothetical protein
LAFGPSCTQLRPVAASGAYALPLVLQNARKPVDGGNGYRRRLWKRELQRWANASGLEITVSHYPTGASKWNPVEHRLFAPISINWGGQPLRSLDLMLGYIRGTTTATGLRVTAHLNRKRYPTKAPSAMTK